ncbi:47 kDa outer membrane protein precursor [mine drainage metagenome]|uniref:47 kDa outer membrane protein n=1 Tax=mine drainage metagenome TaxID=410659 RepID=A0A1J5S4E2_9ZZZZ
MKLKKTFALLTLAGISASSFATNGMDLEGYGPVAAAMGGASFAYDNGAGAMMNNPATLGLMGQGSGIGVALGFLGPDVNASSAKSGGDAYYMPAIGYVTRHGALTYGIGVYSQGGMGTEYDASSPMAYGTGDKIRSEVGVGRVILPLAYNVNDQLIIGGSLDFVWATMDMKMAASTPQFMAMATGNMSPGFGNMLMNPGSGLISRFGADAFRIDFSDNNAFSGKASGSGFAGKLGLVYKLSPSLSVGATYHAKTHLGDMTTDANGASFSAFKSGTPLGPAVTGKITIHDFQWPETYGFGLAYQVNENWLVAADYKRIDWSGVMQDFRMTFSTGSDYADFRISQNWNNQNVLMIGASYRMSDTLTLRFGGNFANNPVPDNRVNPLFPAIIKDQYTLGMGYLLTRRSGIDLSLVYAPKVTVTGTQTVNVPYSGAPDNATTITHSQLNWQLQYGYHF